MECLWLICELCARTKCLCLDSYQEGALRSQELAAFDGRTVAHKERHRGQLRSRLGRVHYLGVGAGLKCFRVMFEDGSSMTMSGVEVRNRLMPEARSWV
eukprot:1050164-Pelagomonas_calceolata.AAC.1